MRRPPSSSLLSSSRRLRSPTLLRPLTTRAAPRNGCSSLPFAAGALVTAGVAWGLHRQHARSFSNSALLCEEQQKPKDEGFLSSLPSLPDVSLPSLPDVSLPDIPKMPKMSLDFDGTIKGWQETFAGLSKAFSDLQTELTGGKGSTVAKILDSKDDPNLNEEIQWDASVRLGTELGVSERAFLRNRKEAALKPFAKLMGVAESEVEVEDIPVIAIAGSGGGYRAMVSTLASISAAKESGIWDLVSYCSAISGSTWALNTMYGVGEGDIDKTIKHVRERITTPFLDPSTVELLTNQPTSQYLLSGAVLKQASKAGEVSIVDAYGTLVSARLYVPSNLEELANRHLKISHQRHLTDSGENPLPIYCTIRHELPNLKELEEKEFELQKMKSGKGKDEAVKQQKEMVRQGKWMWFETTPYEVGCDELGAWIPTWSLGRLFENGKSVERTPELSLTIMSGIFASAFCATLFSYYNEVRPLLTALPFFGTITSFVEDNKSKLDSIHPFPPAELPNFLKGLDGKLREGAPEDITKHDNLGFMDAGANLNIPYIPLWRRDCDIIISLDASADSQDLWFTRAAEYAAQRSLHLWPRVDSAKLFPELETSATPDEEKRKHKSSEKAASKVDEAKAQEVEAERSAPHEKQDVNPHVPPVGSGPHSAQWSKVREDAEGAETNSKPIPTSSSVEEEAPLGKCNIWIGSSKEEDVSCRNDHPTVDDVVARDGMALAYFPLTGGPGLEKVTDVWSTWRFEYTEEETDKMVALAKANFKTGEKQLITLIEGMWKRKRAQRLAARDRLE